MNATLGTFKSREPMLRPLPRRAWLASADAGPAELKLRTISFPKIPAWMLIWRGLQWLRSLFLYMLARAKDGLAGNKSHTRHGQRLRELFERVGATGVKIGQQLAMRVDFFPFAVCRELDKLLDAVPPFSLEEALKQIESSLGQPVSEIFAEIDPKPIGSASIACVWSATLHSGERVAVKVRRPGIERLFLADIELVSRFSRTLELLSLVRPDFLKNLRTEMREMFLTELDFVQEANYQIMFRRLTKKAKLQWVSAPKVYVEYSTAEVLTTEFVSGRLVLNVLEAVESKDKQKLDALRAEGIDPMKIGSRLLLLSYWMRLESFFFHSDPHPGNIFVLPGNKIVMIDFGSCGVNSSELSSGEYELSRRFVEGDIAGATNASLVVQAPFPNIDLDRYSRVVQRVYWQRYIDLKSKQAEWWERTTASIWIAAIEATRAFQIPVNISILRLIRSSLLYDTVAYRLNPDIDFIKSFRRWGKAAQKRGQRVSRRDRRRLSKHAASRVIQQLGNMKETAERGGFWANRFMHNLPKRFAAVSSQASYFFATMIRLTLTYMLTMALGGAGVFLYLALFRNVDLTNYQALIKSSVEKAVTSPVFIIVAVVGLLYALGLVQKKLREKDE